MAGSGDEVSFGRLLRSARLAAAMTQDDLAAGSGLSVRAIRELERDRTRRPYLRSVGLLADALKAPGPVRTRLQEAAVRAWQGHERDQGTVSAGDVDPGSVPAPSSWLGSWTVPRQLPLMVSDFIGRAPEISQLTAALSAGAGEGLAGVPGAVISGQPGVGKTTLALRVAHSLRSLFPDGQLWVQLAGASARPRDPGEVLGELLRGLGVHGSAIPSGTDERAGLFRSWVADRRVLLMVDDAASSAQVRPLLPGTSGNAVIVTSRTRLSGLPGMIMLELDPFAPEEAVGLLTRIAGEERVAAEPQAASEVAAACGLVPLAVRIAGAKLVTHPSWPVSSLARKMADERGRLDELEVEDLSVRISLALSYETLSEPAKRAFRLLGLLGPSDLTEWVVAALLGQPDASVVVAELAHKSLLAHTGVDATGQERYRLHDLLREYAAERLAEESASARDAALRRALTGWLQLADLADRAMPPDPYLPPVARGPINQVIPGDQAERLVADAMAWFRAERSNLRNASSLAIARGWHTLAIDLACRQASWQHLQNRNDDASVIWSEILPAVVTAGDIMLAAHARFRYAAALIHRGRSAGALSMLDNCIEQFQRVGDHMSLAFAFYWRASCVFDLNHFALSNQSARRGVVLSRQIGSRQAEFLNLRSLGVGLVKLGHLEEGLGACEQALEIASELDENSYELAGLHALAFACVDAGEYERCIKLSRRRLDLSRRLGAVRDEAVSLGVMGDAFHGLGRYEEAVEALSAALTIFQSDAKSRYHALCLLKLGYAYQAMSQYPKAVGCLEESWEIFQELHLPYYEKQARRTLHLCSLNSRV